MTKDYGKQIKGWDDYIIFKNGKVRNNRTNHMIEPNYSGCITFYIEGKRKSISLARLIAIHYLDMPDDKKYKAYRKDWKAGWDVSNVYWK